MAHAAISKEPVPSSYGRVHYMIRAKLFKGLITGTMQPGSIMDDERIKMRDSTHCCFCGGIVNLSVDHLVPRFHSGPDTGDNMILACRSCNSSKGKKDLLEWGVATGRFPPLLILRRYLKIAHAHFVASGQLELPLAEGRKPPAAFPARSFPNEVSQAARTDFSDRSKPAARLNLWPLKA